MLLKSARPEWFTMLPPGVLSKLRFLANKYSSSQKCSCGTLKHNVLSDPDRLMSKYNQRRYKKKGQRLAIPACNWKLLNFYIFSHGRVKAISIRYGFTHLCDKSLQPRWSSYCAATRFTFGLEWNILDGLAFILVLKFIPCKESFGHAWTFKLWSPREIIKSKLVFYDLQN